MYKELDKTLWAFKQSAKVSTPEGERIYGLFPLPDSVNVDDLINDSKADVTLEFLTGWQPVSAMGSDIHVELIERGIIRDPKLRYNDEACQWVGETDWLYKCSFETPSIANGQQADILFDGLDTCVTVWLNKERVYSSRNGYISHRFDVTDMLSKKGAVNHLVLHFASAFRHGRDLEARHGHRVAWNGDPSRVYIRKPQYHYGWDWGPTLLTCGIKHIPRIHVYWARLSDMSIHASLEENGLPRLEMDGGLVTSDHLTESAASEISNQSGYHFTLTGPNVNYDQTVSSLNSLRYLDLRNVSKWWPRGHGRQNLYNLRIELIYHGKSIDVTEFQVGFRKIELVQNSFSGQPGTSFFFRINGRPIFLAGSNWIPGDSFPSRMSPERYKEWLSLLVEGGQNALRVWGGGFYEDEAFYSICDELGIIVWQDFMFACGLYPADLPTFVGEVKKEATQVTKRLGKHPCLALFAGNNEDYQVAESLQYWEAPDKNPESWLRSKFPARYIYEKILPEIVSKHCRTHYHPGSPWNTGTKTRDADRGDIHQWAVWHGEQRPYQEWHSLLGRFVSEFGMQAYPDARTICYFQDTTKLEHPQARVIEYHDKAGDGPERLARYLIENVRYDMDTDSYIYASQLMQAECLALAYQSARRQWKGSGQELCGGALVWQLNDVYPCISWSIADYFLRPKIAYYAIKRVIAPITINLQRSEKTVATDPRSAHVLKTVCLEIWGANSTLEQKSFELHINLYHLTRHEILTTATRRVQLAANAATEVDPIYIDTHEEQQIVGEAKLLNNATQEVVARAYNWPSPLKYLPLLAPKVTFALQPAVLHLERTEASRSRYKLTVTCDSPAKCIQFQPESDQEVRFSDNGFDLMPGDSREIDVETSGGTAPVLRYKVYQ